MDDWYKVTLEDIERNGGGGLLRVHYNGSPSKALQNIYPNHNWMVWRSEVVPKGYWDTFTKQPEEAARMVNWLREQLGIKCLEEWYRVSLAQIGTLGRIRSSRELVLLLRTVYPQHEWDEVQLQRIGFRVKASQREVVLALQQLFPEHSMLERDIQIMFQEVEEDHKHEKMAYLSGTPIELDAFIEDIKLAVEYQGEQHYTPVYWMGGADLASQKARDLEKRKACFRNGITLIEVPYWWDRTTESLAATIHKQLPELVDAPPGIEPISTSCPGKPQLGISHL